MSNPHMTQFGSAEVTRRDILKGAGALIVTFSLAQQASAQLNMAKLPAAVRTELTNRGLDGWLAIDADGKVTGYTGKVELGNGNATTLAQILAEELDVAFEDVTMILGDTNLTPNQGATGGSGTIFRAGASLRVAGAEARMVLLDLAAAALGAKASDLEVDGGVVSVKGDPSRSTTYAKLIGGKKMEKAVSFKAQVKHPSTYKVVGKSARRVDVPGKVTGGAMYVGDLRLPNMAHARIVRAPSYGASLTTTDFSEIQKMPGVIAVLPFRKGADPANPQDPRLADAIYALMPGDFVGIVAEREEQALAASARAAEVFAWKETPSLGNGSATVFDDILKLKPEDFTFRDDRLVNERLNFMSEKTLTAEYRVPYHAHGSIGPSLAVGDVDVANQKAVLYLTTQSPFGARTAASRALGFKEADVHVKVIDGTGMYGRGLVVDTSVEVALLSAAVKRPVRLVWSRKDEMQWAPYRTARVVQFTAGIDLGGRVSAIDAALWLPWRPIRGFRGENLLGTYGFSAGRIRERRVTAPLRSGFVRGVWHTPNTFGLESMMDELANLSGQDPLEFRVKQLGDSRSIAVLEAVANAIGYKRHVGVSGRGIGLAVGQYETESATVYIANGIEVEVDPGTGKVVVKRIVVAQDAGLVINPDAARNQIEGGTIQALSMALKEQVTFDNKMVTSIDWNGYPILRFEELPDIEILLINRPTEAAKGMGEPMCITVAPALANAIFDAVGARVREMPFTPARVKAAMPASKA